MRALLGVMVALGLHGVAREPSRTWTSTPNLGQVLGAPIAHNLAGLVLAIFRRQGATLPRRSLCDQGCPTSMFTSLGLGWAKWPPQCSPLLGPFCLGRAAASGAYHQYQRPVPRLNANPATQAMKNTMAAIHKRCTAKPKPTNRSASKRPNRIRNISGPPSGRLTWQPLVFLWLYPSSAGTKHCPTGRPFMPL